MPGAVLSLNIVPNKMPKNILVISIGNSHDTKRTISIKDIVIMATEGVVDAFDNEQSLIDYVGKLATNNPQSIADAIVDEALRLNKMSAKDDMTVLVARTFLIK